MRKLIVIGFFSVVALSCKRSPSASSTIDLGDGDAILQSVLDPALLGYKTQFSEISWSGFTGSESFAMNDSLVVEETTVKELADKLSVELKKLPSIREWESHGFGGGTDLLSISYEEGGIRYYMDFILNQQDRSVKLMTLYKGIRR